MTDSLSMAVVPPTRCDNCGRTPGEGETMSFYETVSSDGGRTENLCHPCDRFFRENAADLRRRLIKIGAIVPNANRPLSPGEPVPPWQLDRPTFRILTPAA